MRPIIKIAKGIYIHFSVFLVFGAGLFFGCFYELALAFLTALIHECAHLLCALFLKEKCVSVALMPYGAKLLLKDSGNLKHEFLIAAAGPALNLLMALIYRAGPFYEMNLSMLIINLVPALPADGGRMLYLMLSAKSPYFALGTMRKISAVISVILLILGALQAYFYGFNLSLFIIGTFLLFSALDKTGEARLYIKSVSAERKKLREPVLEKCFAVSSKVPARRLVKYFSGSYMAVFDVFGDDGKIAARISENDVIDAIGQKGASAFIFEIGKKP